MRIVGALVCASLLARVAVADSDNRPQDRFSFAISASVSARANDAGIGSPGDTQLSGVGLETSYWANDYLAFAYDVEILALPASDDAMAESTNTGFGASIFAAVPLRYIQPYAGVWGGLRYNFVAGDSRGANLTWAPRAGVNFYVNRNLRLFSQWESISLEEETMSRGNVLSFGARWSPDVFHRQRVATKFSAVYGFAVMSFGIWALATIVAAKQEP